MIDDAPDPPSRASSQSSSSDTAANSSRFTRSGDTNVLHSGSGSRRRLHLFGPLKRRVSRIKVHSEPNLGQSSRVRRHRPPRRWRFRELPYQQLRYCVGASFARRADQRVLMGSSRRSGHPHRWTNTTRHVIRVAGALPRRDDRSSEGARPPHPPTSLHHVSGPGHRGTA